MNNELDPITEFPFGVDRQVLKCHVIEIQLYSIAFLHAPLNGKPFKCSCSYSMQQHDKTNKTQCRPTQSKSRLHSFNSWWFLKEPIFFPFSFIFNLVTLDTLRAVTAWNMAH